MLNLVLWRVTAVLVVVAAASAQQCPSGWEKRPGDRSWCYLFSDQTRAKNFNEAQAACKAKKAQLIKIDSTAKQTWVTAELTKRTKLNPYFRAWWVGLNRVADKKTWKWTDRSGLNTKITPWYTNRPLKGNARLCASLYNAAKTGLTDDVCTYARPYICQMRSYQTVYCDSDNGWEPAEGTCYKYMDYRRTWKDAKESCEENGADLATVLDDTDSTLVRDMAREHKRDVWIGLYSQIDPSLGYKWLWSNGSTTIPHQYFQDPVNVPAGQENSSCVAVSSVSRTAKSWVANPCSEEKMYVCEKPEGHCAPGWKSFGTNCYQFNTLFSYTFDAAMRHCSAQAARLVEIVNDDQQQFINKYLPDMRAAALYSVWIGIWDRAPNVQELRYTSNRAVGPWSNWYQKPPKNTPGVRDCVYISTGDRLGRWMTVGDCLQAKPFICFASSRTLIRPISTPPPNIVCTSGYRRIGLTTNTCFRFFDKAKSWLAAQEDCQAQGGDLAAIPDQTTQENLQRMVTSDKWVGLNDRNSEGQWVWTNGQDSSGFQNWSPDRSTSAVHTDRNCIVLQGSRDRRGKWLDKACNENHGYICEKASVTLASSPTPPATTTSWTVNCGPFWEEHAALGHCYQYRADQLTYINARQTCLHQGGDLASITSLLEQNYIEGRVKSMGVGSYWIGANDKGVEGGWRWIDGAPFSYLNWAAGQPDDYMKNQDCTRLMAATGQWDDSNCGQRYAYICKKTSKAALTTKAPVTQPMTPPSGKFYSCPPGYRKYQQTCYMFFRRKSSWQDAQKYCRHMSGDLATIQSAAENKYIASQAVKLKGPLWIGLNDLANQMDFRWSDSSPVLYTNWAKGEPNNYRGHHEDCVGFNGGGWNDYDCKTPVVVGMICEAPQVLVSVTTRSPMLQGCNYNALGYFGSCYQFVVLKYTWAQAEYYCAKRKGHLVSINDRYVGAFVSSELATRAGNWWTGLSDRGSPGRLNWSSKQKLYYTNWDRTHTGKEKGTCIALSTTRPVGLWRNRKCTERNQFICEYPRKGFTNPPTTTRPTVQPTCPAEWADYNGYCYKAFYAYTSHLRKTWTEARDYCRAYGSDLASIHSDEELQFIVTPVLQTTKYLEPSTYWIGLNDRDSESGYEWSDGSPNDYVKWGPGQPNNHNDQEDCVEFDRDTLVWNDANCALAKNYICKVKKGLGVRTTVNPQTSKPPTCGTTNNWYRFNTSCFYYSYWGQEMTWYDARKYCLVQGGELASLHSPQESAFVTTLISKEARTDYWIGLNELSLKFYQWSDLTPLDYRNWAVQEPNDEYGGQRCVNTYNYNGEWNDNNCAEPLNFICKRPDGDHHRQTLAPTPPIHGGCPKGFLSVGPWSSKCYYLAPDAKGSRLSWTDARRVCQGMGRGADLASVGNQMEQYVIISWLTGRQYPLWIGLNDLHLENKFVWADNSDIRFSFWAKGEPNGVSKSAKNGFIEDCVRMYPESWRAGRWNDATCSGLASYICQALKAVPIEFFPRTVQNPAIPVQTPAPLPAFCNKPGYQAHGDNCYKVDATTRTWQDANKACRLDGANLASITSSYEQALMRVMLKGKTTPYWIGLSDSTGSPGTYVWSDGWPTLVTYWARGEPSKRDGEGCVAFNPVPNGRWNDTQCSLTYPAVCKITIVNKPAGTPVSTQQGCAQPNSYVSSVNNYCYYYDTTPVTWSLAQAQCSRRGMSLVAITNQAEQSFILNILKTSPKKSLNMWIGLTSKSDGGFMWEGGRVADAYNNWAPSEPSNDVSGYDEDCVEMDPISGKWYDQSCSAQRGYICWAPKVSATTVVTAWPVTGTQAPPIITNAPWRTSGGLAGQTTRKAWNPFVTQAGQTTPRGQQTPWPGSTPRVTPHSGQLQGNPAPSAGGGGLSGGAVAGIVVTIVVIVAGLVIAGLLIHFKKISVSFQRPPNHSGSINNGFDNALYSKSGDTVNVN